MNYSKQRETMLKILRETRTHPTANDIYVEMRRIDPKISLGTVYRNLALLTKNGEIMRIDTDQDSVHYDGFMAPHYHHVCNQCGRITDLDIPQFEPDEEIEKKYGCSVTGHAVVFYGICSKCNMLTNKNL